MLALANNPVSVVLEAVDKIAEMGLFLPKNLTCLTDNAKFYKSDYQSPEAGKIIALNPVLWEEAEGPLGREWAVLQVAAAQELTFGLVLEVAAEALLPIEAKKQSEFLMDQALAGEEGLAAGFVRVAVAGVFAVYI